MKLKSRDIRDRLKDIEAFLLAEYKESKETKKRDWRTYEQRSLKRLKGTFQNLEPLIEEATDIKVNIGVEDHQSSLPNRKLSFSC